MKKTPVLMLTARDQSRDRVGPRHGRGRLRRQTVRPAGSTDEVYGSIPKGSFKESDPVGPRNPYSASKAGGELMGMAYFHTSACPS